MKKITLFICLLTLSLTTAYAQTLEPFGVEAESGAEIGTSDINYDYLTATDGSITYVYPNTNLLSGSNPGSDNKVITYTITFPEAGEYDLYVKLYVGVNGDNDDSFYTPRSVGSKVSTDDNDWVNINALNIAGHTSGSEIVTGNSGAEILSQWKWVNVSQYYNTTTKWNYKIDISALTVTFQIGAREDGLWIDKLVFGKTGTSYTVNELEGAATLGTKKYDGLASSVKVYPNPSNTEFTINSKGKSISYKLYNILGAKVEEGVFGLGTSKYGGKLNSGTYILDMYSDNKRSVTKLIKL